MRAPIIFASALSAAVTAACSPAPPTQDKAYYVAHAQERAVALLTCQADPGRLSTTPNCLNAQAADADAHAQHFYDAPAPASRVSQPAKL